MTSDAVMYLIHCTLVIAAVELVTTMTTTRGVEMISTTLPTGTNTTTTGPCTDLDTAACQKMKNGRPDFCSDLSLAKSICASFCGLCPATTTTVMNPTTTSPIVTSTCDDIDSSACHLMAINKPDLCMDAGVANGACKRFCKLCPLTCYNCTGVLDYHDCKTRVECKQGEVCMMKQLRSYLDAHIEYEMTCEPRQRCDGGDLALAFGRRDVSGRDLSVSCCADDLCNYPEKMRMETTTDKPYTTTLAPSVCKKDIIFLVGSSVEIRGDEKNIKTFIEDIVKNLDIGRDASLVSLAKINGDVNKVWDLDSYFTKPALITAIGNSLHLSGYRTPNIDAAIQFVKSYAATSRAGDRPDVDDVVVLITGTTFHTSSKTDSLTSQLHSISNDVIRIGIGRRDHTTHIATDAKHDFHVQTGADLAQMTQKVVDLICQ